MYHDDSMAATATASAARAIRGHSAASRENRRETAFQNTASASESSSTISATSGTHSAAEPSATAIFARFRAAAPRQSALNGSSQCRNRPRRLSAAVHAKARRESAGVSPTPDSENSAEAPSSGEASWLTAKRKPLRCKRLSASSAADDASRKTSVARGRRGGRSTAIASKPIASAISRAQGRRSGALDRQRKTAGIRHSA